MDYNIYIHDNTSGSSPSNTQPWKEGSKQTEPWQEVTGEAKQVLQTASNPDSLISSAISGLRAINPKVAVAVMASIAVVATADKIFTTHATWLQAETGDNRALLQQQEFHTTIRNIMNPYSATINHLRALQSYRIQNQRQAMNKILLGDSLDNGGVGV